MLSRFVTTTCEIIDSTSTVCVMEYFPEIYRLDFVFVSGLVIFLLSSYLWIFWFYYIKK